MKILFWIILNAVIVNTAQAASISGIQTMTADAKQIGYGLCVLMGIGSCLLLLVDMSRGIGKFLAVTLAVVGIASITAYISYVRGAFGG